MGGVGGVGGEAGGEAAVLCSCAYETRSRVPQSSQSLANPHDAVMAPAPPSSHSPSFAKMHELPQPGGGGGGEGGGGEGGGGKGGGGVGGGGEGGGGEGGGGEGEGGGRGISSG